MMQKHKGLIAATFTPFNKDYSVNYDFIEHQIEYLIKGGVNGALICGSTGEGYSLSLKERKKVAEIWSKNIPDNFLLFIHVGHNAIPEARELAIHARENRGAGILLSAPTYFKPFSVKELVQFCKHIVEDIGDTPVYYYHIPSLSGVDFPMASFLELADILIQNFRGIKFTSEDLDDLKKCIDFKEQKYELIFGRDEILLDALKLGVTVGLGSTYSYMAPLFNAIISEFEAGEIEKADFLQKEAKAIIEIIIEFGGGIVAGKALMGILGMDCGPLRLPLKSLEPEQSKMMEEALNKTILFDYLNNQPIENLQQIRVNKSS